VGSASAGVAGTTSTGVVGSASTGVVGMVSATASAGAEKTQAKLRRKMKIPDRQALFALNIFSSPALKEFVGDGTKGILYAGQAASPDFSPVAAAVPPLTKRLHSAPE